MLNSKNFGSAIACAAVLPLALCGCQSNSEVSANNSSVEFESQTDTSVTDSSDSDETDALTEDLSTSYDEAVKKAEWMKENCDAFEVKGMTGKEIYDFLKPRGFVIDGMVSGYDTKSETVYTLTEESLTGNNADTVFNYVFVLYPDFDGWSVTLIDGNIYASWYDYADDGSGNESVTLMESDKIPINGLDGCYSLDVSDLKEVGYHPEKVDKVDAKTLDSYKVN